MGAGRNRLHAARNYRWWSRGKNSVSRQVGHFGGQGEMAESNVSLYRDDRQVRRGRGEALAPLASAFWKMSTGT